MARRQKRGQGSRSETPNARVTIKDLARDLGMSTATVSRAFYEDTTIADETRQAVLSRAAELGYQANPFARSLATRRTKIVGVVAADLTNPFYPEVLTKLTDRLQSIDLNVMLITAGLRTSMDDALKLLLQYQPDVIVLLAATLSSEAAAACRRAGTPLIFFNRHPAEDNSVAVACDNIEGGRAAAAHLLGLGHRRVAYVAGRPDVSTTVERWEGFRAVCEERGLDAPVYQEAGTFSYEAGYAAAMRLLRGRNWPRAIFCGNDILAIGFMDAARREFGLDIPRDLSVIGFDDIAMASWPSHALTTIRQPVDEMLDLVADFVQSPVHPGYPKLTRLKGTLIKRATTGPRRRAPARQSAHRVSA
jgi:DNA-binding LacI/PurR family transcriptional regulator